MTRKTKEADITRNEKGVEAANNRRNKKRRNGISQQIEQPVNTITLFGLNNQDLCLKISTLHSKRKKDLQESTQTLHSVLAPLNIEQMKSLIIQIDTFDQRQMRMASDAIEVIRFAYLTLKVKHVESQSIAKLHNAELLDLLDYLFNYSDEPIMNLKLLTYRLKNESKLNDLYNIEATISRLNTSNKLSEATLKNAIVCVKIEIARRLLVVTKKTKKSQYRAVIAQVISLIEHDITTHAQKIHLYKTIAEIQTDEKIFTTQIKTRLLDSLGIETPKYRPASTRNQFIPTFQGQTYPENYFFYNFSSDQLANLSDGEIVGCISSNQELETAANQGKNQKILIWDARQKIVIGVFAHQVRKKRGER